MSLKPVNCFCHLTLEITQLPSQSFTEILIDKMHALEDFNLNYSSLQKSPAKRKLCHFGVIQPRCSEQYCGNNHYHPHNFQVNHINESIIIYTVLPKQLSCLMEETPFSLEVKGGREETEQQLCIKERLQLSVVRATLTVLLPQCRGNAASSFCLAPVVLNLPDTAAL